MTPVRKKRRVSYKYPPEAEAEISELRHALQQSLKSESEAKDRVADLEATIKSIQESSQPEGRANEKEADLTSLDSNVVDGIAKFLDGIALLNWVKACRSASISPSLFLKHTVRKHTQKPIDSECFFSESPLENQEELRCELLSNLICFSDTTIDKLQRECPDVVGNVAEWLNVDADSRYAKCMAHFLHAIVAIPNLSLRAFSTDIMSRAELIGFRCIPSVSTVLCWESSEFEQESLFDILAMKTWPKVHDDLKHDCYNYRTSKPPSLATLVNNAKTAIERELERPSVWATDFFCNELVDDIEHEQSDTYSRDIEAWLDSDDRQRYNSVLWTYTSSRTRKPECNALREDLVFNHHGKSLKEYAGEEMKKYKQEVFEALDSLSEQEAGLVDPEFQLSKEKFDEVFISAMPRLMRNTSFSWSRSGANILQQIVEQIHFGSLWKFPVQADPLILGDSRWNGILLLSEKGMSAMATCKEMVAAVDDDDDSEYEPDCETTEEEW